MDRNLRTFVSLIHITLLFVVAWIAGMVNSIAGGGTLLSFPALIFVGIPALVANATNTFALFPGSLSAYWQYRTVTGNSGKYWVWLGVPSLIGGAFGAYIAIRIGDKAFEHLVPWLVLAATALFIIREPLRRIVVKQNTEDLTESQSSKTLAGVAVFQLFVALYGGFFGAGIGILMLASLGLLGIRDIHKMNGLKNLSAVFINGSAAIIFALRGQVNWTIAVVMMIGAILGGYLGATVAQKLPQKIVKSIIIGIGLAIAVAMFYKEFHRG